MSRIFKGVSIVIHAVVIGVASYVQIFEPGILPVPRSALAFEPVTILQDIPLPPAPRRPSPSPASIANNAAPIVAPHAITPETPGQQEAAARGRGDVDGVEGGGAGRIDGIGTVAGGPPPPPPPPHAETPLRVGGDIRPPAKIRNVDPIYPQLARLTRKEGVVILEVVIDAGGRVESVRVLRGEPMLDQAAVAAVEQWRFAPATLNGVVVPVVMTVTVNFQLR